MIGRGWPDRLPAFFRGLRRWGPVRASQVRHRPGLVVLKEFQGPGLLTQQGLVVLPARRARLRGREVLYGLRLPPVPGAQEPQAEHHDLGQEGVCRPTSGSAGPRENPPPPGPPAPGGGSSRRAAPPSPPPVPPAPGAPGAPTGPGPAPQACWAEMPASTMLPRISRNSGRSRVSSSMRRFTSW